MDNLIILTSSEVVWSVRYKFIELTLDKEVLVILPHLAARVSNLCGWWKEVRVLVIWIPHIYKFGVEMVGLGCHMKDIITRFSLEELT